MLIRTQPEPADPAHRFWFAITMAALAVLYAALINPWWTPSGDSELYLSAARSIVRGQGFMFNGLPVAMVPPAWPYALAAFMGISPEFWFLKSMQTIMLLASLAMWFMILRHFCSARAAALIIFITGTLSGVYSQVFWMLAEPLFGLITAAALWAALSFRARFAWWKLTLVALLCLAAVSARWAGLLQWILVAAALMVGQRWPRPSRQTLAIAITAVVTIAGFFLIRLALQPTPEQAEQAKAFGGTGEEATSTMAEVQTYAVIPGETRTPAGSAGIPSAAPKPSWVTTLENFGHWISWLLCYPLRMSQSLHAVAVVSVVLGWLALLMVAWSAIQQLFRREWLFLGVLAYIILLAWHWPNPQARYLVPFAPLILLAMLNGLSSLADCARRRWIKAALLGFAIFTVAGTLAVNLAMLAVDIYIARSSDYPARFEAGQHQRMVDIAAHLNTVGLDDYRAAVSGRYINMGRRRNVRYGIRAAIFLTDRIIREVPDRFCTEPNTAFARYAAGLRLRYYLYQRPWTTWRVWHFRFTPEAPTGEQATSRPDSSTTQPDATPREGWTLYTLSGTRWREQEIPPAPWPQRVPGL